MRPRTLASIAFLLMVALTAPAAAQQVQATVTMRAPTDVDVGQTFQLEVRADVTGAANAQVDLPDLSPFDVIGRQVSNPVQFRFGFGTQTQLIQSTTVHRLTLRARSPGTFELTPAAVVAQGARFESNPLTIRVGGSAMPGSDDPVADTTPPPGAGVDGTVFDPGGFVRTVVDRAQPYVGQQVTATVYLYSPEPIQGGLQITQEPTTEGFWVHDLLPPTRSLEGQAQDVRGQRFYVYVLRRLAAFPLRAGQLTIGPTGVSVTTGGFFGSVFGGGGGPLSRTGVPVTVEARELPAENRPAGEIHVGTLELTAELDRRQVATGDAVTLTLRARGTGQLRQLNVPSPSVDGLQVLAPQIEDDVGTTRDVVGGTRTFQWLVLPQRAGTYSIGPFEVPVFDPHAGTYSTARAPALELVAAGNPVEPAEDGGDEGGHEARDDDAQPTLAPIHTRSALSRSRSSLLDAPWIRYGFGLGPLLLLGALGVRVAQRRGAKNGDAREPRRAQREAKRRMANATRHAEANEPREFYAAIAQALKEVLEAKLDRAVGSLTHAELRRVLVERGMAEGLADRVVDELEGCDFARFSAAGVRTEEMRSCLERTRGILAEIDRFSPRAEVNA